MKNFLVTILLLALTIGAFSACKDTDTTPNNITDVASRNAELSTLVSALEYAGLTGALNGSVAGQSTVFAPTNAAFTDLLNSLGVSKLSDLPAATVKDILLYHVVSGEVRSTDLSTGYVNSSLNFAGTSNPLSLYVNLAGGVKINEATVSTADVDADNGVIHIVNKVLLPPTVVNHALNNPNFSSLVAALTRADLGVNYVDILSADGPFTVFAPVNAAFTALLAELGLSSLDQIPAGTLNSVLQYHVVSGANVRSSQLTNGQEVTTLQGGKFTVNLTGGAKITDGANRVSNIVAVDVQAQNGVVHAIDKVLLPQ